MNDAVQFNLSTEDLAAAAGVVQQTVRAAYCRSGNYLGLVPIKLPNRFLRWPSNSVEILTGQILAKRE
jgi:hypothetical protein